MLPFFFLVGLGGFLPLVDWTVKRRNGKAEICVLMFKCGSWDVSGRELLFSPQPVTERR